MGLSKDALEALLAEYRRQYREVVLCEKEEASIQQALENKRSQLSEAKRNKGALRRILRDNMVELKPLDAELKESVSE